MTLCNPKLRLERAQSGHCAIGAFSANTLEQLQAIVLAAQAENAPACVQVSHRALAGDASIVESRKYLGPARDAMIEAVRERLCFFNSANTAVS